MYNYYLLALFFMAFHDQTARCEECKKLRLGQYLCQTPYPAEGAEAPSCLFNDNDHIYSMSENCTTAPGITCWNGSANTSIFQRYIPCQPTNNKDFATALLLSIFLGWLGIDRFYLGYLAIGFFKLCTFGFFFVFHLVDILLIALQIVGPADGSAYVIDYYGPKMKHILFNNETNF